MAQGFVSSETVKRLLSTYVIPWCLKLRVWTRTATWKRILIVCLAGFIVVVGTAGYKVYLQSESNLELRAQSINLDDIGTLKQLADALDILMSCQTASVQEKALKKRYCDHAERAYKQASIGRNQADVDDNIAHHAIADMKNDLLSRQRFLETQKAIRDYPTPKTDLLLLLSSSTAALLISATSTMLVLLVILWLNNPEAPNPKSMKGWSLKYYR